MGADVCRLTDNGLVTQSEHVRGVTLALSVTAESCNSKLPALIQAAGSLKFKLWLMSSRFGLSCQLREGSMVTVLIEFKLDQAPPDLRPSNTPRTVTGEALLKLR